MSEMEMSEERDLFLVVLDVEGTLTPEAWLALQERTQLEELKLTTAHEPDYDKFKGFQIDTERIDTNRSVVDSPREEG